MKRYHSLFYAFIMAVMLQSVSLAQGVKYDEFSMLMKLLQPKKIDGIDHIPFFIKAKEAVDFNKANFRLSSQDGAIVKLSHTRLLDIPIDERTHEDISLIEEGYQIKLWVPRDPVKYKGWSFEHDLAKGIFTLTLSKTYSSISVEERRKNQAKEAEKNEP